MLSFGEGWVPATVSAPPQEKSTLLYSAAAKEQRTATVSEASTSKLTSTTFHEPTFMQGFAARVAKEGVSAARKHARTRARARGGLSTR